MVKYRELFLYLAAQQLPHENNAAFIIKYYVLLPFALISLFFCYP
jgi:hypothetical protein